MFMMRRYAAALVAASALTLGACGSEAPTAPENPADGSVVDNPRLIALNPTGMVFTSLDATAPGPQTLAVSGLVAIGSAVTFGTPQYTPASGAWLMVDPRPTFRREPLAWLHTVSISQAVYASLPNGVYTATVPVIVPAALNSPQMLAVTLCKGAASCLPANGVTAGSLSGSDGTWSRGANINAIPGGFFFDDYFLTVPAMSTVHLTMHGSCSGGGLTLGDPYIYVFDLGGTLITADDDGFGCLNSYVTVPNGGMTPMTVRVRATSWNSGATGSYELRTSTGGPFLRADAPVPAEFAEIIRQKALAGGN